MGKRSVRFQSISLWDHCTIHFIAVFIGAWVLCKRLFKWTWDRNAFIVKHRDSPPACLVDPTIGQHKYIKLKGIKFHYIEAGSKDQPLLLLLHGFPDCWLSWRHQIPALSKHFRVVALDLKGFGDSDKPVWRINYRIRTILEELKQIISALGVTRCTIIGHDLGGLLGWYLVHDSPEIVNKFIVISCPHPNIYWETLPPQSVFNSQWMNFIQLPYLPELDALKDDLKIISDSHPHLHEKDAKNSYIEAYKYSFSRQEDWTGPVNYFRNLPFFRISNILEPIEVPTLLVTGSKDQRIQLEGFVKSTEYCEKIGFKIIDGAGHFPHQEFPEAFNAEVLKFLKVNNATEKNFEKATSKGIMNRMFGAVTSTVKYGNSMLDGVKPNGVVASIPAIGANLTRAAAIVKD